jgi:hypothetical protein
VQALSALTTGTELLSKRARRSVHASLIGAPSSGERPGA